MRSSMTSPRAEGRLEQLDLLEELAHVVKDTSMCGLGQTAPNPVLSTLRYFRDEYLEHIENETMPGRVCKDLITYVITENCTGCQLCVKVLSCRGDPWREEGAHIASTRRSASSAAPAEGLQV